MQRTTRSELGKPISQRSRSRYCAPSRRHLVMIDPAKTVKIKHFQMRICQSQVHFLPAPSSMRLVLRVLHEYLQGLGPILKEYNAFSVGEMPCVRDPNEVIKSARYDRGELNMIFHFEL